MKPFITLPTIALALTLALTLAGCRSHSGATSQVPGRDSTATGNYALLASLQGGAWTDAKIPFTLRLSQPVDIQLAGTLTMRRGRDIGISLRLLGMEVASAYVTGDSVYAAYRMGRVCIAESTARLLDGLPLRVDNVQQLLLGRLFVVGAAELTPALADAIQVATAPSGAMAATPPPAGGVGYTFNISASRAITSLTVTPPAGRAVTTLFSRSASSPSGPMASGLSVKTSAGSARIEAAIDYATSKAAWDTGTTPTWRLPSGYRRVSASSLMQSLSF